MIMDAEDRSDDLRRLIRWQDSGATWRVLSDRNGTVTVALCRCDDESEEVDRLVSKQPDLIDFVRTADQAAPDRADG